FHKFSKNLLKMIMVFSPMIPTVILLGFSKSNHSRSWLILLKGKGLHHKHLYLDLFEVLAKPKFYLFILLTTMEKYGYSLSLMDISGLFLYTGVKNTEDMRFTIFFVKNYFALGLHIFANLGKIAVFVCTITLLFGPHHDFMFLITFLQVILGFVNFSHFFWGLLLNYVYMLRTEGIDFEEAFALT
ncbi:hypothetical protein ACJX0J_027611, partial [Zea mays]